VEAAIRHLRDTVSRRRDSATSRLREACTRLRSGLVGVTGRVRVDGCTFRVDSPVISAQLKRDLCAGHYEAPEREALRRFLDPALPVVGLGGSLGVVSCLTNNGLQEPTRHVVVEANPDLLPLLEENRRRNGCRFTIVPRALAYGRDDVEFSCNRTNFTGSSATESALHPSSTTGDSLHVVLVKATTLERVLDDHAFERCTLICDIEGSEAALLRHENHVIRRRVDTLIVELHEWYFGSDGVEAMRQAIEALGLRNVWRKAGTFVFQAERGV
jgi:FkbM family methyltransferase